MSEFGSSSGRMTFASIACRVRSKAQFRYRCLRDYNANVLAVSGLGKRYGDRWLFRNLTFNLKQGDALVVLGRNGAGKSTLLRAIAGLLVPSEGSVTADVPDTRTGVALSALEMSLYPALTLREHLRLAAD